MNKFGIVIGIAAVAVVAGCKDPSYHRKGKSSGEVKGTGPAPQAQGCQCAPGTVHTAPCACGAPDCKCVVAEPQGCKCPPGTKHTEPCACGASDCKCIVVKREVKPLPPPEPEYTVYIVQRGDYLSKISKKYNIKVDAIKKLNGMKDDNVRIGQKLKLPGKVEVGEQTVPAGAFEKTPAKTGAKPAKAYAPYAGATKEYVVKNGDTLGSIAYGNGINIRQLKELNGLENDRLRIGQKLKIPAEKVVVPKKTDVKAAAAKPDAKKDAPKKDAAKKDSAKKAEAKKDAPAEQVAEPAPADAVPEVQEPAPAEQPAPVAEEPKYPTYTVQAGEDLADVSIRWGVSAAAIRELNNLDENAKLVAGQVLRLPADAQQQP